MKDMKRSLGPSERLAIFNFIEDCKNDSVEFPLNSGTIESSYNYYIPILLL